MARFVGQNVYSLGHMGEAEPWSSYDCWICEDLAEVHAEDLFLVNPAGRIRYVYSAEALRFRFSNCNEKTLEMASRLADPEADRPWPFTSVSPRGSSYCPCFHAVKSRVYSEEFLVLADLARSL